MRITLRPTVTDMVSVCIGDVIQFEVHQSHVRHRESLRVIIAVEIDAYLRWGRVEDVA